MTSKQVVKDEDNRPKKPESNIKIKIIEIVLFLIIAPLLVVAIVWYYRSTQRENVRAKAEIALKARFNDTSSSVGKLEYLKLEWQGGKLIATWTQNGKVQKLCTAPVISSKDGMEFGIEPFDAVPIEKQDNTKGYCISPVSLESGLPVSGGTPVKG